MNLKIGKKSSKGNFPKRYNKGVTIKKRVYFITSFLALFLCPGLVHVNQYCYQLQIHYKKLIYFEGIKVVI